MNPDCMWDVLPCEIIIESLARFKFQHNWVFLGFKDDITNLHLKTSRRMKTPKQCPGAKPPQLYPAALHFTFINSVSTVHLNTKKYTYFTKKKFGGFVPYIS